jgi:hypothetical protein
VHQIEWKKNGEALCINDRKYIGGGVEDSYLTITSSTKEDAGQYTCIVTNAVGSVSENIKLGNVYFVVSDILPILTSPRFDIGILI